MKWTGSHALSVVAIALAACLAAGAPDAAAQEQGPRNPISSFFNAIFGGGQQQRQQQHYENPNRRPSDLVPNRRPSERRTEQRRSRPQPQQSAPRRSSTQAASAPAPKTTKNPDAMKVVVFGDAFASGLAKGLEDAFAENADLVVVARGEEGLGLAGAAPNSLKAKVDAYIAEATEEARTKAAAAVAAKAEAEARAKAEAEAQAQAEAADEPDAASDGAELVADPDAPGETEGAGDAAPVVEARPDIGAAVVMVGMGDRTPITTADGSVAFGTEMWRDLYSQRVEALMETFTTAGIPLYWVGLPPVEDSRLSAELGFFNEVFRMRSYRAGAEFVDIWNGFVDANNAYAQSGPDIKGEIRELRTGDGAGFTVAGNRKLAHFVAREIRRDFVREGEVVTDVTVMSRAGPRPFMPSEEMRRTGRGEVVNLNGLSGTGLLAGGLDEGPTPPENSAYRKVILQGHTLPPESGRSDDFSWPREPAGG
ncbi:DUF459 domain-containing protein [Lutibaculum baratangense]|uniref:DUF459 domain-containing protein n=1 Tax=Lutibaculum baratangense AMV1 TaxID=631454 RepID=V4RFU6_9HYPH|nr:DUF459 domain-containing protein [Lutibaculum baratangense]ESR24249.1 hypothetical protein N177_2698 [Lutibaculum baratangense AMV1]